MRTARDSFGERPALSTRAGLRDDTWSYHRLWDASTAVAGFLVKEIGLAPGSRVLVWGANSPQLVAAYFGSMLAETVLVPVDPLFDRGFVERVLEKTRASAVVTGFVGDDFPGIPTLSLSELPFDAPSPPVGPEPAADDIAEIVFTSGTTGSPKGVVLTHRNIVACVDSCRRLVPARPYRLVSILPLSHMLEQTLGLYVPLYLGGSVHYPTSRHPRALAAAMRRHRVTALVVVPLVLDLMYQGIETEVQLRGRGRRWRRAHRLAAHLPLVARRILFRQVLGQFGGELDFVVCGGARLSERIMLAWERMGIRVVVGYGTTECAPLVTANSYTSRVPGSVGRPAPGVSVRLSNEGEILVEGANVTPGYWEDPAGTAAAFDAGHWYRTGDLGRFDDEGRLCLTGRLKDLIVLPSGLNVHPEDVEEELRHEPDIADCVVVSLPDAGGEASVHAVVIASPTSDPLASDRERVGASVRAAGTRLAPHQRVTGITLWKEADFPRTNLRKVKRHEVIAAVTGAARRPPAPAVPRSGDPRFDQVRSILADITGVKTSDITADSDLAYDLALDSLGRVELALALEAHLGAAVDDGDLAQMATVGDLLGALDTTEATPAAARFPRWARRPGAVALRRLLQRVAVYPLHSLVARPFTVDGAEELTSSPAPVLLIANHSSHLDTPSILRALPPSLRRSTAVAAAADYFYAGPLRGAAMSLLLNAFPFSREGGVRSSLEYCGELADAGWSVLIYPEGTRSTSGALGGFRSGIALLAQQLRIPVIPVGVTGTHELLPKGSFRPRSGPVGVRFGRPIVPAPGGDRGALLATLERAVADLVPTTPPH